MVKTVDERHAEAERHPDTSPPCTNETEFRMAARSGKPEALIALAQALIDDSIEHQDPDEALVCLEKARLAAGTEAESTLTEISALEVEARQKQHELGEAQQLEYMHNQDA